MDVRPTTDRVRESLFGILEGGRFGDPLADGFVVDAFAGTGALGLEALSRGAERAVFIERDRTALATLRRNIAALRFEAGAEVIAADTTALTRAAPCPAAVVFLDPPYDRGLAAPAITRLADTGWIGADTLVVLECAKGEDPLAGAPVETLFERTYGRTRIVVGHRNEIV